MTNEEIEKEAEDFLKKSLKVDDDEFDFFKNEASCKEEIKRLTDFVEPREKRIEILEKEKCDELSGADVAGLIEMAKNERRKFEKRLETYLKRYGLSKLSVWTYYRD